MNLVYSRALKFVGILLMIFATVNFIFAIYNPAVTGPGPYVDSPQWVVIIVFFLVGLAAYFRGRHILNKKK